MLPKYFYQNSDRNFDIFIKLASGDDSPLTWHPSIWSSYKSIAFKFIQRNSVGSNFLRIIIFVWKVNLHQSGSQTRLVKHMQQKYEISTTWRFKVQFVIRGLRFSNFIIYASLYWSFGFLFILCLISYVWVVVRQTIYICTCIR